jgi:hypothetical protein
MRVPRCRFPQASRAVGEKRAGRTRWIARPAPSYFPGLFTYRIDCALRFLIRTLPSARRAMSRNLLLAKAQGVGQTDLHAHRFEAVDDPGRSTGRTLWA